MKKDLVARLTEFGAILNVLVNETHSDLKQKERSDPEGRCIDTQNYKERLQVYLTLRLAYDALFPEQKQSSDI